MLRTCTFLLPDGFLLLFNLIHWHGLPKVTKWHRPSHYTNTGQPVVAHPPQIHSVWNRLHYSWTREMLWGCFLETLRFCSTIRKRLEKGERKLKDIGKFWQIWLIEHQHFDAICTMLKLRHQFLFLLFHVEARKVSLLYKLKGRHSRWRE